MAILVHGGGWTSGDKETDIVPVFALVATNFCWFTINYRLAPTNRWPACFEDVQTAVRWVKRHAAEFKGNPNRIALLGYSASGQLALLAAMSATTGTPVQAVVGLAPPTDLVADAQHRGGLENWFSMTNLLGWEFLDDETVAYNLTQNFQARLQAAGFACDLLMLTNVQHRLADWEKFDPNFPAKIIRWLNEKLPAK